MGRFHAPGKRFANRCTPGSRSGRRKDDAGTDVPSKAALSTLETITPVLPSGSTAWSLSAPGTFSVMASTCDLCGVRLRSQAPRAGNWRSGRSATRDSSRGESGGLPRHPRRNSSAWCGKGTGERKGEPRTPGSRPVDDGPSPERGFTGITLAIRLRRTMRPGLPKFRFEVSRDVARHRNMLLSFRV